MLVENDKLIKMFLYKKLTINETIRNTNIKLANGKNEYRLKNSPLKTEKINPRLKPKIIIINTKLTNKIFKPYK